jgi:hypothetical protein
MKMNFVFARLQLLFVVYGSTFLMIRGNLRSKMGLLRKIIK